MKRTILLFITAIITALSMMAEYPKPVESMSGKYGYANPMGKLVIKARFDNAMPFREGFARVEIDGKWGFINLQGRTIVKCVYEEVRDFNYGYAIVRWGSKWGAVNTKGEVVVPCEYNTPGEVYDAKSFILDSMPKPVIVDSDK
ncbi:MAG: WG repeat-containing protein [Lachnoclostridium sp.]|nr:WG repeat-containing protein [Lachnoclostridium sp.]